MSAGCLLAKSVNGQDASLMRSNQMAKDTIAVCMKEVVWLSLLLCLQSPCVSDNVPGSAAHQGPGPSFALQPRVVPLLLEPRAPQPGDALCALRLRLLRHAQSLPDDPMPCRCSLTDGMMAATGVCLGCQQA